MMKDLIPRLHQWLVGWIVLCESMLCDAVTFKVRSNGRLWISAWEAVRFTANLIHNVERDFKNGADRVVILLMHERMRSAVRRKLRAHLPDKYHHRIRITTVARIERIIERLQASHAKHTKQ